MLGTLELGGYFNLTVVPLIEQGGMVLLLLLGQAVIGRGCGVGEHQIGFSLEEHAVGFAPSLGHGDRLLGQLLPQGRSLVALGLLDPQQQTLAWRAGARIFVDDLQIGPAGQLGQTLGRVFQLIPIVDEGEVAIVEGEEGRILPATRQRQRCQIDTMLGKELALTRLGQHGLIHADDQIGFAVLPL